MNTQKQALMVEGGKHLKDIRQKLVEKIRPGITPLEIDALADELITKGGDYPSFKTVRGYHHATCINLDSAVVHGIPTSIPLKPGQLVTIDVGLVHKGWHLDTSVTTQVSPSSPEVTRFLETGRAALNSALQKALPRTSIYDISLAMQIVIEEAGYNVIRDLTGHGIGKQLHESPHIPCYADRTQKHELLRPGQAIAIEIMYSMGDWRLKTEDDGWTLSTVDGSLTAMFEESVFITENGQIILTR